MNSVYANFSHGTLVLASGRLLILGSPSLCSCSHERNLSVVDMTCELEKDTTYENTKAEINLASETYVRSVGDYAEDQVVSSDFIGVASSSAIDDEASIMPAPTFVKLAGGSMKDINWCAGCAALTNIIPSSTGAAKSIAQAYPIEHADIIIVSSLMFPIKHADIWQMYKKHEASFWTAEEIGLSQDNKDWDRLSESERHLVKQLMALFAASDGIVVENLTSQLSVEVQAPEVRAFYGFQIAMESIHSETYSLLIEQYIRDHTEKGMVFNAIETMPAVKEKANWAIQWMSSQNSESKVYPEATFESLGV